MTVGVTKALELGVKAVICASTGNTSASLAAYAAKDQVLALSLSPGSAAGVFGAGSFFFPSSFFGQPSVPTRKASPRKTVNSFFMCAPFLYRGVLSNPQEPLLDGYTDLEPPPWAIIPGRVQFFSPAGEDAV